MVLLRDIPSARNDDSKFGGRHHYSDKLLRGVNVQQAPLGATGRVDRILRVVKPTCRNQPRPIVRIHVADKHEVFGRQVAEKRREGGMAAAEKRFSPMALSGLPWHPGP